MSVMSPFNAHYGSNQAVYPAAASASITVGNSNKSLSLSNSGANICYVRTGQASYGTVTATAADIPVLSGHTRIIQKPEDHDTVAYISAGGTTLQIMSGEGGI